MICNLTKTNVPEKNVVTAGGTTAILYVDDVDELMKMKIAQNL
jgi:hypothetical protein